MIILLIILVFVPFVVLALIDLSDVVVRLRLLFFFLVVAHVFLVLILLNGLGTHHVRVVVRLLVLLLLLVIFVLPFLVLVLLLLLVLLKHQEVVLVELRLGRHVAGEVGGGRVEAVVVLSTQKQLLLLICQVSVRVQVRISQDVHILLKFTDLGEISHECLGHLLDK